VCDGVYSAFQTGTVSGVEYRVPIAYRAFSLVLRENLWTRWRGLGLFDCRVSIVCPRVFIDSQAVCRSVESLMYQQ